MTQYWNDPSIVWQTWDGTNLKYKDPSMSWNNSALPWKAGSGGITLSNATVPENSANGTAVGTASITGSFTGVASWSLTDNGSGTWTINSGSGAITVLSNTLLDFETHPTIPIIVAVSGTTPSFASLSTSIGVTNVVEAPVNSVLPVISGTAAVGSLLAVTTGTWSDMGAGSFGYQWKSNTVNIGGATASTFTPIHAQAGTAITCAVTATNTAGNATATSDPTASVTEVPSNTVIPTISGSTTVGSTLTESDGTWLGSPSPTFAYQWLRSGTPIGGATASTYLLVTADLGSQIRVQVTGTNSTGFATGTSNATATITAGGGGTIGQPIGLLLALTEAA